MLRTLVRREGPVVPPDLSVATLVHEHLIPGDDRALPVVQDGALLGLVSMSDVRSVPPDQWASTLVRVIMRPLDTLSVAAPRQSLAGAFEQLARMDVDQMPVVDDGKLVGSCVAVT
jgi:CBS domain-containing protein